MAKRVGVVEEGGCAVAREIGVAPFLTTAASGEPTWWWSHAGEHLDLRRRQAATTKSLKWRLWAAAVGDGRRIRDTTFLNSRENLSSATKGDTQLLHVIFRQRQKHFEIDVVVDKGGNILLQLE